MEPAIEVRQITKRYTSGNQPLQVLQPTSFTIGQGESAAIVGPSGSGKTTLLTLCAGLELPSEGSIRVLGQDLTELSSDDRAVLRRDHLGFIFQSFHLMPSMNALENTMLPLELRGVDRNVADLAREMLDRVGLADRMGHYPAQLSGGEQQRVAIARAFINQPKILFADEPTGNLDHETSQKIEELLFELNKDHGATLLLITHDDELAAKSRRLFRLRRGVVAEDQREERS